MTEDAKVAAACIAPGKPHPGVLEVARAIACQMARDDHAAEEARRRNSKARKKQVRLGRKPRG